MCNSFWSWGGVELLFHQPLLQVFNLLPLPLLQLVDLHASSSENGLHRLMSQAKCGWLKVPFCLERGAGILAEEPKLFWCRCLQGRSLHCTFLWALLWGLFVSFSSSLTSASENKLCLCVFSTFLWECLTGTTAAVRWLYVFKAELFCVEASGRERYNRDPRKL